MKKKFALIFALAVVGAGVFAAAASAIAFDDSTPCPTSGQLFVCPQGTVGASYSIQLQGRGGCGPALPYQYKLLNGALPPGLSLSTSGQISGTPTIAGTYDFWIELSDEDPPSQAWCLPKQAQREFSLTVSPRVIVTTSSAPAGTVGATYNLALQAQMMSAPDQLSPPSSPLTWSIVEGSLPPGLALGASDGVVSGTPTTAGSYLAKFQARLADGRSDTKSLGIVIRDPVAITPLRLHWDGLHGSEVGIAISTKLAATGGTGIFTWSLGAGSLPTGVALGADGTIAGKPKLAGTFPFTVQVADSEGRTATVSTTLTVAAKLSFKTVTLRAAKVGRVYNAKLVTLGGVTPVKWTILRGTLPRGIHFAKKLGMFTGTPKREGTYRVTVQAVDGYGIKTQKTFVLVVKA